MQAGGYGRGAGVPLQDRVRHVAAADHHLAADVPAAGGGRPPCPARHCWVVLPGSPTVPGLLLEWRRVDRGGFEGLVVHPVVCEPDRWAMVTQWLPAARLRSAESTP